MRINLLNESSFQLGIKKQLKCMKIFCVSKSTWVFQLRHLIATFSQTLRFSALPEPTRACQVVTPILQASSTTSKTHNICFSALLPVCLCMWERGPTECGWPSPAGPLHSPNFFLHSSFGPKQWWIADWWVQASCHKDIGKTQPQPKEHEGWKTPSGPCIKEHKPFWFFFHLRKISHEPFFLLLSQPETTS